MICGEKQKFKVGTDCVFARVPLVQVCPRFLSTFRKIVIENEASVADSLACRSCEETGFALLLHKTTHENISSPHISKQA